MKACQHDLRPSGEHLVPNVAEEEWIWVLEMQLLYGTINMRIGRVLTASELVMIYTIMLELVSFSVWNKSDSECKLTIASFECHCAGGAMCSIVHENNNLPCAESGVTVSVGKGGHVDSSGRANPTFMICSCGCKMDSFLSIFCRNCGPSIVFFFFQNMLQSPQFFRCNALVNFKF